MDMTQLSEVAGFAGLAGITIAVLTQFLKKRFPKKDARVFSIGLSGFFGLFYALGLEFIPPEFLTKLAAFGATVFAMSTGIYKIQKGGKKPE